MMRIRSINRSTNRGVWAPSRNAETKWEFGWGLSVADFRCTVARLRSDRTPAMPSCQHNSLPDRPYDLLKCWRDNDRLTVYQCRDLEAAIKEWRSSECPFDWYPSRCRVAEAPNWVIWRGYPHVSALICPCNP